MLTRNSFFRACSTLGHDKQSAISQALQAKGLLFSFNSPNYKLGKLPHTDLRQTLRTSNNCNKYKYYTHMSRDLNNILNEEKLLQFKQQLEAGSGKPSMP